MRASLVKADGTSPSKIADQLVTETDSWTQFAGWSPDGRQAIIVRGWEDYENAQWEEKNKNFRYTKKAYLVDSFLVDLETKRPINVTGIDRVSFYNTGLFFWKNEPGKLGFTAIIDGNSHPFRMTLDGKNKTDLTKDSKDFSYGFSSSPDGKRIAYHKNYQIYIADADGNNAQKIETQNPFNFAPAWSPDGSWLLFVSGEHYNCHPCMAKSDGTGFKKLADRGGYRGVVDFIDVPDFHGGSSDVPCWSKDGKSVFYTAILENKVELFQITTDGAITQLTKSKPMTLHYHPQPSPDGKYLVYGSKRDGVRQLFVMNLEDKIEKQITNLQSGSAAMWPHWQTSK
jgi:Tol biopolymer transport system component